MKPSEILSREKFKEVASEITVEPLVVTGDGTPKNPYDTATPAEKIRELAEELRPTDPDITAMLYVIVGCMSDPDPQARQNLFELLIQVAKVQREKLRKQ